MASEAPLSPPGCLVYTRTIRSQPNSPAGSSGRPRRSRQNLHGQHFQAGARPLAQQPGRSAAPGASSLLARMRARTPSRLLPRAPLAGEARLSAARRHAAPPPGSSRRESVLKSATRSAASPRHATHHAQQVHGHKLRTHRGNSTSWIWMSSKPIIPGNRCCVVNGYSATSGLAWVSARSREDLPALGRPASTTWAAPPVRSPAPLPCRPSCRRPPASLSLARRRFRSANGDRALVLRAGERSCPPGGRSYRRASGRRGTPPPPCGTPG